MIFWMVVATSSGVANGRLLFMNVSCNEVGNGESQAFLQSIPGAGADRGGKALLGLAEIETEPGDHHAGAEVVNGVVDGVLEWHRGRQQKLLQVRVSLPRLLSAPAHHQQVV